MKRVLIIGSGEIGVRHIKAFHDVGDVQIFCYGGDASCLKDAEINRQPIKCCYGLDEVPVSDLDGVVIASPTHTHPGSRFGGKESSHSKLFVNLN